MGKDPAMPLYVNDWLSSAAVTCMTLAEQGAYMRLLCHCWASQDASLPDDDDALASLSGLGEGWLKCGSTKLRKCLVPHPSKSDFLTNERLFALWAERQKWREKSVDGGRKSAENRRLQSLKGGLTKVPTNRQPKGNSSSSSSSSELNTNPPAPQGEIPEGIRFREIPDEDLKDPVALDAWFASQSAIARTEDCRVKLHAAWLLAQSKDSPAGWLRSVIRRAANNDWWRFGAEDIDAGARQIKSLRSADRVLPAVAELGAALMVHESATDGGAD